MRIIVVGAGSLGSVIGGQLFGHHEVHLMGRGKHIKAIRDNGLTLEGATVAHLDIPATDDADDLPDPELMIFTTKAYNTEDAARVVQDVPTDGTLIMTLQNGLGNLNLLSQPFGEENLIAGITSMGATRTGPGIVYHAGPGRTVVGRPEGDPDDAVEMVAETLNAAFPVEISGNMRGEMFLKALANAAINPLTALHGVPNGMLLEKEDLEERMDTLIAEAVAVAVAAGIDLPTDDPVEYVHTIVRNTSGNRSSMLQDVDARRPTEVYCINGVIAGMGRDLGVSTPTNRDITKRVHALEESYRDDE